MQEGKGGGGATAMNPSPDCNVDTDSVVHEDKPVSVCMIGTGEYTTGYVYGEASDSDKGAGGTSTFLVSISLHFLG